MTEDMPVLKWIKEAAETPDYVGYLASPYSHANPGIMYQRYRAVLTAQAWLLDQDVYTYGPIASCHYLHDRFKVRGDHEFWKDFNRRMLSRMNEIIVLTLEGWEDSVGVQAEREMARTYGKRTVLLPPEAIPDSWECSHLRASTNKG